ncbi:hypothetical protein SAMN05880501_11324 [Ureibacillus xyleni]|uniref:Uncharacterized protein n=1 Tax=Ureibacillus xyleni TaxID=614648 RepID=A0A285TIL7_9BACL|nr:DUF6744 family protein [Ureibacillus xyleni]SOC21588.1 hypothetical protein SAMN05880501_11324 [Ureibacillus xyleni]
MHVRNQLTNGQFVAKIEGQGNVGHLFWYSIQNVKITREELEQKMIVSQVDTVHLPNPIRPSDAFRRATQELKRTKVPTFEGNVYLNYLTREVTTDTQLIQRNVVIERVDRAGKKLAYDTEVVKILLNKSNNTVTYESTSTDLLAKHLAEEAKERYEQYKELYDSQNIRQFVGKVLDTMATTSVRASGGVYFVPCTYDGQLMNLASLINDLADSTATCIPLFNIKSSHEMVNRQIAEDMKKAIYTCETIVSKPGVTKAALKEAMANAKKIAQTYNEYKAILDLQTEVLDSKVNDLRLNVVGIIDKLASLKSK